MRTAGDPAALVSIEGAWKVFKYRTGVLSTNTPEKNPTFDSFTITLSSKRVKYKRLVFHLHPQINSKQGGLWISYIICLLVTQGQSTALQREPNLWYWKQVTVLPSPTLKKQGTTELTVAKRPVVISRMWLQCFINDLKMTVRIMSGKEDIYVTAADKLSVSLTNSSWYYSECAKEHFWFIAGPDLILKCVPQAAPVTEHTKILLQPSPFSFFLRNSGICA